MKVKEINPALLSLSVYFLILNSEDITFIRSNFVAIPPIIPLPIS